MSEYRKYVGGPISKIPRHVFEEALGRLAKRDRELILTWWDAEQRERERERRRQRDAEWTAIRHHQHYRDLEHVVRDQRRHIASLEEQLLPYLQAEPVDQEALL